MGISICVLDKHTDNRGVLIEIIKKFGTNSDIRQVYVATSTPGQVRGNHYHKEKTEWLFVIKGECRLVWDCDDQIGKKELALSYLVPVLVRVPPYVVHAILNTGPEESYLLIISDRAYDPASPDTYEKYLL